MSCDGGLRDGPEIDVLTSIVRADPLASAEQGAIALAAAHADPDVVRATPLTTCCIAPLYLP